MIGYERERHKLIFYMTNNTEGKIFTEIKKKIIRCIYKPRRWQEKDIKSEFLQLHTELLLPIITTVNDMVRPSVKLGSAKLVVICVSLLGFALIADFLWASSSPSSYFPRSTFKTSTIIIPKEKEQKKKNSVRLLADAYADLPAPQLVWEKMKTSPVPRLDGAAIQIRNLFFVFAGYADINTVTLSLSLSQGVSYKLS